MHTYTFMKDKNTAGLLALILGFTGVQWFYLKKNGMGFAQVALSFMFFPISFVLGLVTAFYFFGMDPIKFQQKYAYPQERDLGSGEYKRFGRSRPDYQRRWEERSRPVPERRPSSKWVLERKLQAKIRKAAPFKKEGIKQFKEYDYPAAIDAFEKALSFDDRDPATHFNLACAYSLVEDSERAFYHIDKAVGSGFDDFHKIKSHDALAYLRIQDEFDTFERNNFRLPPPEDNQATSKSTTKISSEGQPEEDLLNTQPDLLDQLKKLKELRESGLLSEEDFEMQKRKLLD
ncbi:MAG: NINE protein [Saprospiraceae bacterium]|nr:NINE protein [Saprospiraceae bacterium]